MTPTLTEAANLALEALGEIEWSNDTIWQKDRAGSAIAALDAALAQEALPAVGEPRLAAIPYEKHEAALLEEIDNRDRFHEWADRLANAIAEHLDIDIGEHSSVNCPLEVALLAITNQPDAAPTVQAPSEVAPDCATLREAIRAAMTTKGDDHAE